MWFTFVFRVATETNTSRVDTVKEKFGYDFAGSVVSDVLN